MASHQPGVWGIDLGLCALKAIRLEFSDNTVRATAFDYIEHPKILSQPDADPDQLTREALEQFLSRNQLAGDKVVISVAGQSGLARFVKLPPVEERKIADIVKFEAKQQIPFPLEEVVWDFQKIGTPMVTDGLALETEIGLFAMKKDMVNRALTQFKDVDVEVHIIQMAPLALINYIAYDALGKNPRKPGEDDEGGGGKECVVALDVGTDNSNLVITDGERIIWQRAIPLGGNHFTRALTKDMKLTFAKAEHLKRNAVKSPDLRKILASLKSVLSDFVGEVQRSLGYFTNTHRDAQIKFMVGLGGAFRLPGLQKFLQEKLQLEVRKISKFERLKGEEVTSSPQFNENILSFAVPYGLALQGLKLSKLQTNLLPQEIRSERMVRGKKPWAAAAAAALLFAVAGLLYAKSSEKAAVTGPEIAKHIAEIGGVQKDVIAKQNEFNEAVKKLNDSKDNLRRLVAGVDERFNWQLLAQYINLTLPQPNGNRLSPMSSQQRPVFKMYYNDNAIKAFDLLEKKRAPTQAEKQKNDPAQNLKDDEFIKQHLIQVSIEGIHALYCDDFSTYFKNINALAPALNDMTKNDREIVRAVAEKPVAELPEEIKKQVPEKAWVVEIRGYTYHDKGEAFIKDTIIENLRNPDVVNPTIFKATSIKRQNKDAKVEPVGREKMLKDQVIDKIDFLFLYKSEEVENPEPGTFRHIKGSHLPQLVKMPKGGLPGGPMPGGPMKGGPGDNPQPGGPGDPAPPAGPPKIPRDMWRPIGEIAGMAHGAGNLQGGGGIGIPPVNDKKIKANAVPMQPRREFVILFVWKEPLPTLDPTPPQEAKKD